MTSILSRDVNARSRQVRSRQRLREIAACPPEHHTAVEPHSTRRFGLRMTDERCQSCVWSNTHQEMDVVSEDRALVDVHRAAHGGLRDCVEHVLYIRPTNEAHPPPRVPGNVYIQAVGLVHGGVPSERLTPGRRPGVQGTPGPMPTRTAPAP